MKNFRSKIIFIAAAGLAAVSCADNDSSATEGMPIAIYPDMKTRVTETSFEDGDRIGVDIYFSESSSHSHNAMMTYGGKSFTADEVKWYDVGKTATFEAYYPYENPRPQYHTILGDQTGDGYQKSDALLASATNVKPNASGVSLAFRHVLSRLVITVDNQSGSDIQNVWIHNSKEMVSLDPINMSATVWMASGTVTIKPRQVSGDTFMAIIAPAEAELEITISNDVGSSTAKFPKVLFESGMSYSASVTLDKISDITEVYISSDGDISDWKNGGPLAPL